MRFLNARPKDPRVIQYLVEIANILTDNRNGEEDLGDALEKIMAVLNMSEEELQQCHGRRATETARHIMKFKYPNPSRDFKFSDISDVVKMIIKYTRISNPSDSVLDVDIRHAMGNYVAAYLFKAKRQSLQ
ncbi:unnamed protein product [Rotaria sp. Silwood1]|nr:unnamed protein product [Rotaria sp. Silwood1]